MSAEMRKITCTICAVGCPIEVEHDGKEILSVRNCGEPICDEGKRGVEHARREFANPVRVLTTTLRVRGGAAPLVPVKTAAPIPKSLLMECMRSLARIEVNAPIEIGTTLVANLLGTGADVVATASVPADR